MQCDATDFYQDHGDGPGVRVIRCASVFLVRLGSVVYKVVQVSEASLREARFRG